MSLLASFLTTSSAARAASEETVEEDLAIEEIVAEVDDAPAVEVVDVEAEPAPKAPRLPNVLVSVPVVNAEGKNFIMQPQVCFPIKKTNEGTLLCDGEMPDFVVLVTITFKSNGRTFMFSQRYLPEIKTLKRHEAKSMENLLLDYEEFGMNLGGNVDMVYPSLFNIVQKNASILRCIPFP